MIEPLRYQTEGKDWIARIAIGGGVTFLWFVVFIPVFPLFGYLLAVMRRVMVGETDSPPDWGEYELARLTIDGAKAFGLLFVYGLVVGVVTLLPPGILLLLGAILESGAISALGSLLGSVLSLVGTVVFGVVAPIMLCNFVVHDDLNAGFDMALLRAFATHRAMLRALGLALAFAFAVSIVSGMLVFTIVGPAVAVFVGLSSVAYIWADGFADAYRDLYGELPEIPDGPAAGRVGQSAGPSASGSRGATTGEETASAGGTTGDIAGDGSSGADGATSGPAPSDERRD